MNPLLLLPLLLLGAVSALHLENDAPSLDSPETQADLSQDLEGSGEQQGELALSKYVIPSEGEADKATRYPNAFEDDEEEEEEEDGESDPSDLAEDIQCPKEEDTVQLLGSPGCKICHYRLVRTLKTFRGAQRTCKRCYRGSLVSIHSFFSNHHIQFMTKGLNQAQVWIGGTYCGWWLWRKLRWTDGSSCNFKYWAPGQPKHGGGHCVTLSTREKTRLGAWGLLSFLCYEEVTDVTGGHWRRARCKRRLPFICHVY